MRIRIGDGSGNEQYRTCAQPVTRPDGRQGVCGADCVPEPFNAGANEVGYSDGMRIAFSCPEHGVHSVVDPFEGSR